MFSLSPAAARLSCIALLLAGATVAARASDSSPLSDEARAAVVKPAVAITGLTAITTIVNSAPAANIPLASGFNDLSTPLTLKCGNAAGCTVTTRIMGQISPPAATLWAVCVLVDSTYANPGCPYQGTLPAAGTFVTGNGDFYYTITKGTHTITPQIYASQPSTLGEWTLNVTLYKQ